MNVQHNKCIWPFVSTSSNQSTSRTNPNNLTSSFLYGRQRKEVQSVSRSTSVRESLSQRGAGSHGRGWRWRNKHKGRQRRRPSSCRYPWSGWLPQLECRTAQGLRWARWSGPSFLPGREVSIESKNTLIKDPKENITKYYVITHLWKIFG